MLAWVHAKRKHMGTRRGRSTTLCGAISTTQTTHTKAGCSSNCTERVVWKCHMWHETLIIESRTYAVAKARIKPILIVCKPLIWQHDAGEGYTLDVSEERELSACYTPTTTWPYFSSLTGSARHYTLSHPERCRNLRKVGGGGGDYWESKEVHSTTRSV